MNNNRGTSYGFQNVKDSDIRIEDVLSRVDEEDLWRFYLGKEFKVGKPFSAPYRSDRNPSFVIRLDSRDRLMFTDYGRPDLNGDIFDYLQKVHGMTLYQSIQQVNKDFKLRLHETGTTSTPIPKKPVIEERKIDSTKRFRVKTRPYEKGDYEYWHSHGISNKTLNKYNVYCVSKLSINGLLVYVYNEHNPCYAYHFPETDHIKCYFPSGNNKVRFVSNVNNLQDIQGYYQCNVKELLPDEKKVLVLTKSMKDCMVLRELGYDSMAIHGEAQKFYPDFIRHIKKYYSVILSVYDRDITGVQGAKYLWDEFRIPAYFLPRAIRSKTCKDVSDMNKIYGREKVKDFVDTIVAQATIQFQKSYVVKRD